MLLMTRKSNPSIYQILSEW